MSTQWRIELLGGLRAEGGGRVVSRFYTQKMGALFAYLAYYGNRAHPRDALIDLLWPEADPKAGRNSLSVALSSLRHQLEPPGVPAGTVIIADRASVQLNPDAVTTDVAEFQAALRSAEGAGSRTEQIERLAQAVARYRGELLPGYYEDWVLQEREFLAERYFRAQGQLLAHLEATGELPRAIDTAQRGVRVDPLREEAHHELIRLLAAAGQTEAALRQYRELERLLKEELGAVPAAGTQALVRDLKTQAARGSTPDAISRSPGAPIEARELLLVPAPPSPRGPLPAGTVTFLLTDIEGSTALWERARAAFAAALESHHALLRRIFRQQGGCEVKEMGDAFLVAFERAGDALACAVAGQRALAGHPWPEGVGALRVRMALHTGDAEPQNGDYHGPVLNCAQRVLVAGHGGQILCSEATAALLRRDLEPGVRLTELGVYRLRDVAAPERLFQVDYPERVRREFPPLKAEAGFASHLPLPLSRFVGRDAEVRLLGKLLLAPEMRLVTLMGPGGSGKTRLALEVARRLVGEWRGAVWFVPLADLADAHRIPEAVRDGLRLPRSPGEAPLEQVVAALAREPTLLLLDNFEHLVDEGAPLLRSLLERAPALTLLVTSRQRLNLAGEREFLVPPLPTPEDVSGPVGANLVFALSQCESVQLFVDRAQAVRPDFQVTARSAAAVAALCRRLEGIPLALELAAARAQVLTPAQMLAQMERRFELLVSRQRDLAERHRTLRGALEWSYRLLAPELQRFFAGLSVFRGGWTLEAAEAVCEEPLALDDLAQLRECSLVVAEEGGEEIRFGMLETLRDYAREQLEAEELADRRRRHAAHYLALAEEAEPQLTGAEQGEWLECLEREHDNLRAALAWCLENRVAEAGLRLGAALWRFWLVRGYLDEGRERMGNLLGLPSTSTPASVRAQALSIAGSLARRQSDYRAARSLHEESLAIWRKLGDKPGIAAALTGLGNGAYYQGDFTAARALHEESLAIRRELANKRGIAVSLNNLAILATDQGDHRTAQSLHEEALAIERELGNRHGIAISLNNLAILANGQGDYRTAQSLHEESLAIQRELGNTYDIAMSLNNLGVLAAEQGKYREAQALYEESLAIRRGMGDRRGIASALSNLGNIACAEKDYATAKALFEESLAIQHESGSKLGVAMTLSRLGYMAYSQEEYGAARALYEESLVIRREMEDKPGIADSLEGLAAVAGGLGQPKRAARLFGAAAALREAIGAPLSPGDRAEQERTMAAVRAGLSEEAFAAAWMEGQMISLEQAVADAVDATRSA